MSEHNNLTEHHRTSFVPVIILLAVIWVVIGFIVGKVAHDTAITIAICVVAAITVVGALFLRGQVRRPANQMRVRIAFDHGPATEVMNRAERTEQANRRLRAKLLSTRRELAATREDKAQLTWQAAAAIGAARALAERPAEVHNHVNFIGDDIARQALESGRAGDWFGQVAQPDRLAIEREPRRP